MIMSITAFFILFSSLSLIAALAVFLQSIILLAETVLAEKEDTRLVLSLTLSSIMIIFSFIGLIMSVDQTKLPSEEDVMNKNAVYQETTHIQNNDTIKTYQIQWKKNN